MCARARTKIYALYIYIYIFIHMCMHTYIYIHTHLYIYAHRRLLLLLSIYLIDSYHSIMSFFFSDMGWLRLVGSLKVKVFFAKEPYKRDDILQKRPIILRSLLIVATP